MFPLSTVLFPGMVLPLQVFEPRYRTLMERCMAGTREFGVTLIERGSEVGGGDVRSTVGTVAEIIRADQTPDGRWAVLTIGTRRLRVERWLDDDPHPRAEVESWPDEPPTDPAALQAEFAERVAQYRRVMALATELGHPAQPLVDITDHPEAGSFQLSMLAPLGPLDRQRLLVAPGPQPRLERLGVLLDEIDAELQARLSEA